MLSETTASVYLDKSCFARRFYDGGSFVALFYNVYN